MNILAVGAGGFIGAVLRYLIGRIPISDNTVFPIKNTNIDQRWILFLKVGICGGFTTFSTFALETTELIKGHIGCRIVNSAVN